MYGVQPLIGDAATEAALRSQAPGSRLIHIAAHGQLNTTNPLFSRLYLAPDPSDPRDDGALEVHEVYGLDLSRADMVTLSACQTQLGSQSNGDDIVGLSRAFIYAGAPTVVASLWSVDDEATAALMQAFYTHLKEGMGKAQALRRGAIRPAPRRGAPAVGAPVLLGSVRPDGGSWRLSAPKRRSVGYQPGSWRWQGVGWARSCWGSVQPGGCDGNSKAWLGW